MIKPAAAHRPRSRRWGRNTRKVLLILHVIASVGWLGAVMALGTLIAVVYVSADDARSAAAASTLVVLARWPLPILAVGALITGILLGLGTRHGVLRHWWVAVKLVLNVAMIAMILTQLGPATDALSREALTALAQGRAVDITFNLFAPPIVSGSALVFATVLSIIKPWGPIRKQKKTTEKHQRTAV